MNSRYTNTSLTNHSLPDIRLIAMDLDGTALNGRGELDARTCAALSEAASRGVCIAAATGRAFAALPPVLFEQPFVSYAITSNGTGIYRLADRTRIYSNRMAADTLARLLSLLENCDCPIEAFIDGLAYAERSYVEDPAAWQLPPRSVEYVRRTRIPMTDMPSFIRQHADNIEGMDIIVTDPAQKKEIRSAAERIPNLYVTSSVAHYLEFAAGSASKQTALAFLTARLDLPPSQVMAFGDAENDLEMLSFAGLGVAMGNAAPPLKEAADYVTDSNDACGVAKAVEAFVLCNDTDV